jgi:hypothetical protein
MLRRVVITLATVAGFVGGSVAAAYAAPVVNSIPASAPTSVGSDNQASGWCYDPYYGWYPC